MSTPEIKQIEQQPVVTEHATDFDPTPGMIEQGITATPTSPQSATVQLGDQQQVTVTSVPAPANGQSITIPSDPQILKKQSKGNTEEANTWAAFFWLRAIKRAVKLGWHVIVGGKPNA